MSRMADTTIPQAAPSAPAAVAPVGVWRRGRALVERLGLTAPLALAAVVLPPLGTIALIATAPYTGPWLREEPLGVLVYVLAFAVLAGLALLPTYAQCALGGFAFGMVVGVPAAVLGFAGGAVIGYEIARMASRDRVMQLLDEHPKWRAVRDALVGHWTDPPSFWRTLGIVALLRVPPSSPFALTKLVMASVKVPRWPFIIGTGVGMLPRSSLAVVVGAGFQRLTGEELSSTPRWMLVGGILLTLVVVVIVVKIANQALERFTAAAASRAAVEEQISR
jgi:uncharacterized membrane protein YdjX (TVP38/TMEM64 family)